MRITTSFTARGFACAEFTDANGQACSLQKSSWAAEEAIWLGVGDNRMHLTRADAAELLPFLERFVRKGFFDATKASAND